MSGEEYIPLGADCHLYRNTGSYSTPTWTDSPNVEDLETGPLGPEQIELGIRGNRKRKAYVNGMSDEKIKGKVVWRKNTDRTLYPDVQALLDAGRNGTPIELLALDGDIDIPGSEGLRMTCKIKLESRTENLGEFLALGFEACQALTSNDTTWFVVPGP